MKTVVTASEKSHSTPTWRRNKQNVCSLSSLDVTVIHWKKISSEACKERMIQFCLIVDAWICKDSKYQNESHGGGADSAKNACRKRQSFCWKKVSTKAHSDPGKFNYPSRRSGGEKTVSTPRQRLNLGETGGTALNVLFFRTFPLALRRFEWGKVLKKKSGKLKVLSLSSFYFLINAFRCGDVVGACRRHLLCAE